MACFDDCLRRVGIAAVANGQPLDLLAIELREARRKALPVLVEGRGDRPIFLRTEDLDLSLTVDDQSKRDRLHPARGFGARKLAPEDRREREADQIVERPPCPVGVDQIFIETARIAHGLGDGRMGDCVERDALHVFGSAFFCRSTSWTCQLIASPSRSGSVARISVSAVFASSAMARNCLARSGETCHSMCKAVLRIDRAVLGRQIAHVPERSEHPMPASQIFLDGLRLAGDSTTTSFNEFLTHTRKVGTVDSARQATRRLTFPPAWRSIRPARSNSSSAIWTAPELAPDNRMISSTGTGEGPSNCPTGPPRLRRRSPAEARRDSPPTLSALALRSGQVPRRRRVRSRAVISKVDLGAASTTTVAALSPAMIRLR